MNDKTRADVAEAGYLAGWEASQWLLDGNSEESAALRLLQGLEDGDPEIMDALPSFSFGEWAGESEREIIGLYADYDELTEDERDELATIMLGAYSIGAHDGAYDVARAFLGMRNLLTRDMQCGTYLEEVFG